MYNDVEKERKDPGYSQIAWDLYAHMADGNKSRYDKKAWEWVNGTED